MAETIREGRYIGSAKIGPKGQIVIPKTVREMFDLKCGDQIIVMADRIRGIAISTMDVFDKYIKTTIPTEDLP